MMRRSRPLRGMPRSRQFGIGLFPPRIQSSHGGAGGVIFWLGWYRIQYLREQKRLEATGKASDKDKVARVLADAESETLRKGARRTACTKFPKKKTSSVKAFAGSFWCWRSTRPDNRRKCADVRDRRSLSQGQVTGAQARRNADHDDRPWRRQCSRAIRMPISTGSTPR